MDIIVEFRRYQPEKPDDTRRVLSVYSREEPFEVVVRWDGGTQYLAVGDRAEATQQDRLAVVLDVLRDHPEATADELLNQWPEGGAPKPGRAILYRDLEYARSRGEAGRTGDGKKGSPHRWRVTDPFRPPTE